MKIDTVIGDYGNFVNNLIPQVRALGIDIKHYPVDHFGYRVDSMQTYTIKFHQYSLL